MMKLICFFALLVFSVSCIKTADQVHREKRLETISQQMEDTQGLLADAVAQIKEIKGQLDSMNGRLEELEHKQKQLQPQDISQLSENVNLMKSQDEARATQLTEIQAELKEQRAFLQKVTEGLASQKVASQREEKRSVSKSEKKKSTRSQLDSALTLVKQNNYAEARELLETLIEHEDLTPGDNNKVLHGLGRVEYYSGNADKALVYFSKIYTRFPKASLAPSSLLFIGRSLEKMGKKDEAKEAYKKVVEDYKGTKEANEAKKQL